MEISLEFTAGEKQGKRVTFQKSSFLVGRSPEADVILTSDLVSFEHCRFVAKGDGLSLTDLGSSNGTFVNGNRHSDGFIASGDSVMFGQGGPQARITFMLPAGERVARPEPVSKAKAGASAATGLQLRLVGGRSRVYPRGKIVIGRGEHCDLPVDHEVVSREHVQIDFDPPDIRIRDLGSTNGTFVNGGRISSGSLAAGDRITVGEGGPEIQVALESAPVGGRRAPVAWFLLIVVVLAAGAFLGYKYLRPGKASSTAQKTVDTSELNEYVQRRLRELSAGLGDPQDDIPLIFVESVVSYINLFTGNLRPWFERSLKRAELQMGMVRRILRGAGLPEEFAYVAFVESGYDTTATSAAGAKGLWQFMPASGRDYGLRVDNAVDERVDPHKATEAACKYIRQLCNLYNSYLLAMASYNTGEGRIANALRRIDVLENNRFWYLVKHDMLHEETVGYVPKIMAAMIIATDLKKFNFEGPEAKP